MKKLFFILLSFFFLSVNLHSKGFYNGNIQIDLGNNINKISYESTSEKSSSFEFGIETWHTFKLPFLLEVGFMFDLDMGFDDIESDYFKMNVYFLEGPAIAFNLLNIVKFNVAAGLAFNAILNAQPPYANMLANFGFGLNIQALALPASPVSPILGYKFAVTPGNKMYTFDTNEKDFDSISTSNYVIFKNEFYLGISFNW